MRLAPRTAKAAPWGGGHVRADRRAAGEQAPAGAARRPAERVGERRRETHSLLWVQRFHRLVEIMPGTASAP
jgi:hypothetical protein